MNKQFTSFIAVLLSSCFVVKVWLIYIFWFKRFWYLMSSDAYNCHINLIFGNHKLCGVKLSYLRNETHCLVWRTPHFLFPNFNTIVYSLVRLYIIVLDWSTCWTSSCYITVPSHLVQVIWFSASFVLFPDWAWVSLFLNDVMWSKWNRLCKQTRTQQS